MKFLASDGVLYMLNGDKHANHLVVSLYSLRKSGYRGAVAIAAGDEAGRRVASLCRADSRLGPIVIVEWNCPTRRTHGNGIQYANKTQMHTLTPFGRTVFLDADTLVVGPAESDDSSPSLADMLPDHEQVRLTRFARWTSQDIAGRIEPWREVRPREVAVQLARAYPAINTGVVGFARTSHRFMDEWRRATLQRVGFICDEIAAQLIFPDFPHVVLSDRWNASPVYSNPIDYNAGKVIVWHGHGFKFHKKEVGRAIWRPWYEEAIGQNLADIATWTNNVPKSPDSFIKTDSEDGDE
jgi:hypothetical protein